MKREGTVSTNREERELRYLVFNLNIGTASISAPSAGLLIGLCGLNYITCSALALASFPDSVTSPS
jgi:hypothetical protein